MSRYIAPGYDLLKAGNALTPEQDELVRSGLILPMLENIGKNRSGKSNWQTWHNAAMISGGAVLGDKAWVDRAINERGNGFMDQMKVSVTEDGMWYENSWAYHFYTLRALILMAEHSRRLEIDLWSHPRLKKMFLTPLGYVMQNGSFPRFGDDVDTRVNSAAFTLEFAYHAYQTKSMLPKMSNLANWDSVMLGREINANQTKTETNSRLFPTAGHAINSRREERRIRKCHRAKNS